MFNPLNFRFVLTVSGIADAYRALFVGSIGSPRASTETLFAATPLILAGLAVAIGFQAGLFNIGVNGQMHIGGMAALWVGFSVALPTIVHIPVALFAAVIAGAIWGGIAELRRCSPMRISRRFSETLRSRRSLPQRPGRWHIWRFRASFSHSRMAVTISKGNPAKPGSRRSLPPSERRIVPLV